MKPIKIDRFSEKCPKCGEKVMRFVGKGSVFWRVIKYNYCPRCGEKMERRVENEQ